MYYVGVFVRTFIIGIFISMNYIKNDIKKPLRSALNNEVSAEFLKDKIIFFISIIATASSTFFLFLPNNDNRYINAFVSAFFIIILFLSRRKKYIEFTTFLVLIVSFVILFLVFLNGGTDNAGILWFYLFPISIFLVNNKKNGLLWLISTLLILFLTFFLDLFDFITLPYSKVVIVQFLVSFLLLGIIVYIYKIITEKNEVLIEKRSEEVLKTANQLIIEIEERKKTEEKLAKIIEETKEKNRLLENTKKAMLNILEDLEIAKDTVEQEKARDESLLSSIGEGIIAVDKEGIIIIVNKRTEQMLGWEGKELVGFKLANKVPIEDEKNTVLQPEERPYYIVTKTGKGHTGIYTYSRKDGTKFPVQITISPIKFEGEIVGAMTVFRDITKEREIDIAKTEFVSLASHQLKTPLSTINWYTEMLLDNDAGSINEDQKSYLNEIFTATHRMIDLVNSLLNVSRIDLGTFAIDPEPININEIVVNAIKDLNQKIIERSMNVEESFSDKIPALNADPKLFRIIVDNLLTNAIKYTPEQGSIIVTTELSSDNESVLLSVKDNGYGIPEEEKLKIFSKLYRASNVKSKDTDGTGLGLYIIKSIMDGTGGKIWFDSAENQGTTFFISIPLSGMKKKEGSKGLV